MNRTERQYVMGVVGAGLATVVTIVASVKFHQSPAPSVAEAAALLAASIGVARNNLACAYGVAGYFAIVKGIPLIFSGSLGSIVLVGGITYLLVQGILGVTAHRETIAPKSARAFSEEETVLMSRHGVSYHGSYFAVGDMHFDHLKQALEHASATSRSAP